MTFAGAVYILGALTGLACAVLLLRAYAKGRMKLLLWSGLCFAFFAISNLLVFIDLAIIPGVSLYRWRLGTATVALLLLLYGLIWESEKRQ